MKFIAYLGDEFMRPAEPKNDIRGFLYFSGAFIFGLSAMGPICYKMTEGMLIPPNPYPYKNLILILITITFLIAFCITKFYFDKYEKECELENDEYDKKIDIYKRLNYLQDTNSIFDPITNITVDFEKGCVNKIITEIIIKSSENTYET